MLPLSVHFGAKKLMQVFEFDTVIVGSGLAGLSAAFHASRYGSVAIVTKSQLDTSNSYYAQGGIAAAIDPEDSPDLHLRDTLTAGRGICEADAVRILVEEGKERVMELIAMGMDFDKEEGDYVLGLEGGHSKRRILHAGGDATGKELTLFMLAQVRNKKNIDSFEYITAVGLIKTSGAISGIHAYDFKSGENIVFRSNAVILATGGLSRVFARSTNPHTATGDGIAMAYEAGARLADLEFIQFHPSALFLPGKEAYLISEAVRGEGAWLLNEKGERFMKDIHPLAELAPRDVVAYSIYRQIQKSEKKHIFLTVAHLDKDYIKRRFSNIYAHLKEFGFDMTCDLLPISPAAHYMVGGIQTNLNAETNIPGLFVCGELASTGVMGANRLASNSLLECLVFGKRASDQAAKLIGEKLDIKQPDPIEVKTDNEGIFMQYQNDIASLMSENLGIVRNKKSLELAVDKLSAIVNEFTYTENEYNLMRIKNTANTCLLIAKAALCREESRGGHIREDYQKESPDFNVHIVQEKGKKLTFRKIRK